MGFLENLFKKEARKLVSGVLDEVVENTTSNRTNTGKNDPDSDCCGKVSVVEQRIRNVVAEEWNGRVEVRPNIRASEMVADAGALDYTYGLYCDGVPVAMIILLTPPNDYWNKGTRLAREACERQRVGYVHFIMRLPNRTCYIREQLKRIVKI